MDPYNSEFGLLGHMKWNGLKMQYELEDFDKTKEALSKHLNLFAFERVD